MDINNSKVNNLSNVFDKLIGKSNTYIPAMHKKTKDSVSLNNSLNNDAKNLNNQFVKIKIGVSL